MSRRISRAGRSIAAILILQTWAASSRAEEGRPVERWGIFEVTLPGPSAGNPFVDVMFSARFAKGDRSLDVAGFYDGEGLYRVRFMPESEGEWAYKTKSNRPELDGKSGQFEVVQPSAKNHGPVQVHRTYHFAYSDGSPYYPVGTTCYAWTSQGDSLEEQTLATLKQSPFNKIRMCVFPKSYEYNRNEPPLYPFEGTAPRTWDFSRFNPEFFRHLERRIGELRDLGIEADLILFHPYDKGHWGFDRMPAEADDRYLRYVLARLSTYRNVWWSLANEFDFMNEKSDGDWHRLLRIVADEDPYYHLRSIHNGTRIYDNNKPWVTHASLQNGSAVADFGRAVLYRDVYEKPIVLDEVKYEGDFPERWGNLSAEEMVHRFWQGTIAGTYVGHGETYLSPDEVVWWSKGGKLCGASPPRIAFLRTILEDAPAGGLDPIDKWQSTNIAGRKGEYYLVYLGKEVPTRWEVALPRAGQDAPLTLRADLIDTWAGTITPIDGPFVFKPSGRYVLTAEGRPTIDLPGRPYMAIRFRKTP
jgi:Domain of unknown function (DUF5060)/Protein of unknown function (DUF4038)/Domain of unknown function (DUF5605)